MRAILLKSAGAEKIINHLVAYGYDRIVVFCDGEIDIDRSYYQINDIEIITANSFAKERTQDKLQKIRGSLESCFLIVYSDMACLYDMDEALKIHRKKQGIITVTQNENKMTFAICEPEVLDYITKDITSFEGEVIPRIAEDSELSVLD